MSGRSDAREAGGVVILCILFAMGGYVFSSPPRNLSDEPIVRALHAKVRLANLEIDALRLELEVARKGAK